MVYVGQVQMLGCKTEQQGLSTSLGAKGGTRAMRGLEQCPELLRDRGAAAFKPQDKEDQ